MKHRHIFAVTIGNALEFYDFLIYVFFSIQIGHALFPSSSAYASLMLSLATFGAGFVTRPIGAVVIGAFADRVGRKPAMLLCFALIGASIVAMALIPSYASIGIAAPILAVIARMAQGFSLGGELGTNTAYLMEAAPVEERGLAVSWQTASQMIAIVVGSGVGAILSSLMSAQALGDYGWRIAFLLGAVTLPFGLWLRSNLPETLYQPEPAFAGVPVASTRLEHLARSRSILAIGIVILGCSSASNYTQLYFVTYAQDTLGMSATAAFWGTMIGSALAVVAALYGGALSDRIGRRPVMLAVTIVYLLTIFPAFYAIIVTRSSVAMIVGISLITVLGNGSVGAFYASMVELLPKAIRGSAFGTAYAIAVATCGGTTQLALTWLIHATGSPYAPAWFLTTVLAIWLAAAWAMPESAPRKLARTGLPLAATV